MADENVSFDVVVTSNFNKAIKSIEQTAEALDQCDDKIDAIVRSSRAVINAFNKVFTQTNMVDSAMNEVRLNGTKLRNIVDKLPDSLKEVYTETDLWRNSLAVAQMKLNQIRGVQGEINGLSKKQYLQILNESNALSKVGEKYKQAAVLALQQAHATNAVTGDLTLTNAQLSDTLSMYQKISAAEAKQETITKKLRTEAAARAAETAKVVTEEAQVAARMTFTAKINPLHGLFEASPILSDTVVKVKALHSAIAGMGIKSTEEFKSISSRVSVFREQLSGAIDRLKQFKDSNNIAAIFVKKLGMAAASTGASFVSKLFPGISKVIPALNKLNSSSRSSGMSLFQLRAYVFTTIAAITGFVAVLRSLYNAMSSQIEQQHQFVVAFHGVADAEGNVDEHTQSLLDSYQELADSWQVNSVAMTHFAAQFKSMINAMGATDAMGEKLAMNFTTMGYDLASLWDVPVDTTMSKLQSGLAGQTKAIRSFGDDITENSLIAEAALEGYSINSIDNLSRLDKTILINNAMVRQGKDAQGDWAASMNTPANMLRILREQLLGAGQMIGAIFIPAIQAALPALILMAKSVQSLATWLAQLGGNNINDMVKQFNSLFSSSSTDASDLADSMDDTASSTGDTASSLSDAAKTITDLSAGFDELNVISASTSTPDTSGAGGAGGTGGEALNLGEADVLTWDTKQGATQYVESFITDLKAAFERGGWASVGNEISLLIGGGLANTDWSGIKSNVTSFATGLGQLLNSIFGSTFMWQSIGTALGEGVNTVVDGLMAFLTAIDWLKFGQNVAQGINSMFTSINWVWLGTVVFTGLNSVISTIGGLISTLDWAKIGADLGTFLTTAVKGIDWNGVGITAWNLIVGLLTLLVSFFQNFSQTDLLTALGGIVNGLIDAVFGSLGQGILDALAPALVAINQWVKDTWKGITSVFAKFASWMDDHVGKPFRNLFSKLWDFIKPFINSMRGGFQDFVNGFIKAINGIITAAHTISFDIPSWVPGFGGNKYTLLGGVNTIGEISIPPLATGGMVSSGQMFIANEAGPELVGSFGNKTGVVNNDQIVAAVSQGVAQAVAAVMSSQGSDETPNLNVTLNVDGNTLYTTIKKIEKKRGTSIYGTNANYSGAY